MDIYDQATEREDRERALSLQYRAPSGPAPMGVCHNCAEPLGDGLRWCDLDCLRDWQARRK